MKSKITPKPGYRLVTRGKFRAGDLVWNRYRWLRVKWFIRDDIVIGAPIKKPEDWFGPFAVCRKIEKVKRVKKGKQPSPLCRCGKPSAIRKGGGIGLHVFVCAKGESGCAYKMYEFEARGWIAGYTAAIDTSPPIDPLAQAVLDAAVKVEKLTEDFWAAKTYGATKKVGAEKDTAMRFSIGSFGIGGLLLGAGIGRNKRRDDKSYF